MTKKKLTEVANTFYGAIIKAKVAGEFIPDSFCIEPLNQFPFDGCDDVSDLLVHYLYNEYDTESIKVDGEHYDINLQCQCSHVWLEVNGWIVDLTTDQFQNDPSIRIKAHGVYVGRKGPFHRQFVEKRRKHSCGIESLGYMSRDRMYGLYGIIMEHIQRKPQSGASVTMNNL